MSLVPTVLVGAEDWRESERGWRAGCRLRVSAAVGGWLYVGRVAACSGSHSTSSGAGCYACAPLRRMQQRGCAI